MSARPFLQVWSDELHCPIEVLEHCLGEAELHLLRLDSVVPELQSDHGAAVEERPLCIDDVEEVLRVDDDLVVLRDLIRLTRLEGGGVEGAHRVLLSHASATRVEKNGLSRELAALNVARRCCHGHTLIHAVPVPAMLLVVEAMSHVEPIFGSVVEVRLMIPEKRTSLPRYEVVIDFAVAGYVQEQKIGRSTVLFFKCYGVHRAKKNLVNLENVTGLQLAVDLVADFTSTPRRTRVT